MNTNNTYKYVLIEDEKLIANNLIKKINSLGLPLVLAGSANNGKDAIALIDETLPHIVFTDIQMPQFNGLELAAYIHQHHNSMKTVIISGYDDFSYAQSAIKSNVFDYLLKPVTVEALATTINRMLLILAANSDAMDKLHEPSNHLSQDEICNLMLEYLELNYKHNLSLAGLAEHFGFTQEYLSKIFKKKVGLTPIKHLTKLRMNQAKLLLKNHSNLEIQKVAEMVGYNNAYYFSRAFKSYSGMQPSEYRQM